MIKIRYLAVLTCSLILPSSLFAAHFNSCKSTYALCTTAPCTPIPNKAGWSMCKCNVFQGYSVGTKPCQPIKNSEKGQIIYSRYYPIKSYVRCSNNRPWAWCLDSTCYIDKNNPKKATCLCSLVKGKGDYIIVTDKYTDKTCTTGLYSSALVWQANQVTEFVKTQNNLKAYPIRVLNR